MRARTATAALLLLGSCEGTPPTLDRSSLAGTYEAVADRDSPGTGRLDLRADGSFAMNVALDLQIDPTDNADRIAFTASGDWRRIPPPEEGCDLVELAVSKSDAPQVPPRLLVLFHDDLALVELGPCIAVSFRPVR